jgi:pyruvate/2-oxoglutarate dehydrogenase complex dihydrolipoamide acyltransferase (E2) component
MSTKVIMPQLGESVHEGTISKWLKSPGEQVNEFDPLLEINTDKVDTEIPSPTSGVLLKVMAAEGEVVEVGQTLAWIGERGESPQKDELAQGETQVVATAVSPPIEKTIPSPGRDRGLGFISPVVARIASEFRVDLTKVKGSGQNGRITKKDILAYVEGSQFPEPAVTEKPAAEVEKTIPPAPTRSQQAPAPASPGFLPPVSQPAFPNQADEVFALTPVRRAIAEHMVYSKHTSPHVTTVMEADLSRVVAHRQTHKEAFEKDGIHLTYTAYLLAAMVMAIKAFPIVNASWSEEGILIHRDVNIGMATSLGEGGLIVPVVKNADSLSLSGLARVINDLSQRARARQLKPEEVKGGTITLTNHGTSGSLFATPIINQPQCAILGAGAIQKRVVVVTDANGMDSIAIRPMVYLSLTFDHRVLDGAIADHFLAKVVESLQNWG